MEHFDAQRLFPLAAPVSRPLAAKIANLTGRSKLWQLRQRSHEDRFVTLAVVWRTERSADRVIGECRARRSNLAHDVVSRADDQGRNTTPFDHVSDETDGLMTEGSVGDEQGEIDPCRR